MQRINELVGFSFVYYNNLMSFIFFQIRVLQFLI